MLMQEKLNCVYICLSKTDSLELTHNEYLDALNNETEFITEFNIVEEYREKALIMEFKSKQVLEKIKSKQNNNESSNFGDNSHLAVCENPYKNTSPQLPELELYKFGGELRDWLTFWNQFKSIHENKNLTNCDKFHYLVQSTKIKSEARELIESFPITDENYPLAIESLTERYGRKERYYEEFPKKLQDSFYVDNCVTSVQNNAELEIFVESATNVMKEGMLDRRGCESSALSASSESTRSPVLGMIWDKNLNALEIDTESLEFDEREKITKKGKYFHWCDEGIQFKYRNFLSMPVRQLMRSIQRLYPMELTPNYEQVAPETQKVLEVVAEYHELNTDSNETVPVSRSGREIKPVKRLDL
ncbi:uncharacterized protein CEXT_333181 [Caerostris extrusa]|uniref:Uncharacterized protein n=1 Tax=Caerostris extrusa TaxID=172846 RepID=A0AAV4UBV5_CAEEX|nr:uncharacterized protein CEXT_333181 [Caerostris extrusa]